MEQGTLCLADNTKNPANEDISPYVKKSNALVRARWGAQSVLELRLVAILASKISKNCDAFLAYDIHLSELFGKKYGGKDIKELERIAKKMMEKVITIRDDKGGWELCHVMNKCKYNAETNVLTMIFHEDLKFHFLNLQKLFTRYSLEDFIKLPSVYSQRLYEFLKSWESSGEVVWALADLHEMMDTPASQRKDFRQFRLFVLEKSREDLHNIDFDFEWEPLRKGRTVEKIKFIILGSREAQKKREEEARIRKEKEAKIRLISIRCYMSRGAACTGGHQTTDVCEWCLNVRDKEVS